MPMLDLRKLNSYDMSDYDSYEGNFEDSLFDSSGNLTYNSRFKGEPVDLSKESEENEDKEDESEEEDRENETMENDNNSSFANNDDGIEDIVITSPEEKAEKYKKRLQASSGDKDHGAVEKVGNGYNSGSEEEEESEEQSTQEEESHETEENPMNTTWEDIREDYRSGENGTSAAANHKAAEKLIEELHTKSVRNEDTIFYYDEEEGVYKEGGLDMAIEVFVDRVGSLRNITRRREVSEGIEYVNRIDREDMEADSNSVCLKDCILDFSDPENLDARPHSPEELFTWKFEAPYIEGAVNEEFQEFLDNSVPKKDQPKLQEYVGEVLMHDRQPRRMGMLIGGQDTGKGVFLRVIEEVVGEGNITNQTLENLSKEKGAGRWSIDAMAGSKLNISNELTNNQIKKPGKVKTLTGEGDKTTAEPKNGEQYSIEPTHNYLFATNQIPGVRNPDSVFYNRWLFFHFPWSVDPEDQIRDYSEKLTDTPTKRAGILNWMIEGLRRVMGREGTSYTNELDVEDKQELWEEYGDSFSRFKSLCVDTEDADSSDKYPKEYVYNTYKEMCSDMGMEPINENYFYQKVPQIRGVSTANPTVGNVNTYVGDKSGIEQIPVYKSLKLTETGRDYFFDYIDQYLEEEEIDLEGESF